MKTYFVFLLSILFGTGLQGQETGFHPDKQETIIQRSQEYTVRLRKERTSLRLTVDRGAKAIGSVIVSRDMIVQVDTIDFVADDKVVLLGAVSGDVDAIVVVRLSPVTIIDRFLCYSPALSPTKRFLAFIKFFPPHFVQGVSDVYLVYDFQKSPVQNRPANVPPDDAKNVGQVIYPPTSRNQGGDNVGMPESEIHMLESGALFWSPKGDQLAFADRVHTKLSLIAAIFSGSTVKVKESEIKKSEVCESGKTDECTFTVRSIQFSNQGHLRLKLRPYNFAVPIKEDVDLDLLVMPVTAEIDLAS